MNYAWNDTILYFRYFDIFWMFEKKNNWNEVGKFSGICGANMVIKKNSIFTRKTLCIFLCLFESMHVEDMKIKIRHSCIIVPKNSFLVSISCCWILLKHLQCSSCVFMNIEFREKTCSSFFLNEIKFLSNSITIPISIKQVIF